MFGRLSADGTAVQEVLSSRSWHRPCRFRPCRIEDGPSLIARFTTGIMPIPDTPYTRAKAGSKLFQYMAAGLPVVSSAAGVNRELVEQSQSGFLATTAHDWESAIRTRAADPEPRAELGANARSFIERIADVDAQARTLGRLVTAP